MQVRQVMQAMQVSNENLVLVVGGHAKNGLGHQRHLPIFKDEKGNEYVSVDGITLQRIDDLNLDNTRRETVTR